MDDDQATARNDRAVSPARRMCLVLFVALVFVDTMPYTPQTIRRRIDLLLDVSGWWQGPWGMFAPDPDRQNRRLRIVFTHADLSTSHWASPEWGDEGVGARFRGSRWTEYFDNIIATENASAWPAMLNYYVSVQQATDPARPVIHARLCSCTRPPSPCPPVGEWRSRRDALTWGPWQALKIQNHGKGRD